MGSLRWADVEEDFQPDGALRDIYIEGTGEEDWQRVVDVVGTMNWPTRYFDANSGSEPVSMPRAVGAIFAACAGMCSWEIKPARAITINCHFFAVDEIEFDLNPSEIIGQPELDVVVDFLRAIGDAARKPVILCHENAPDTTFVSYDPRERHLRLARP